MNPRSHENWTTLAVNRIDVPLIGLALSGQPITVKRYKLKRNSANSIIALCHFIEFETVYACAQ